MKAEINIGMLGHVDHGKTSLTRMLTGKWTDTHSEELKRGITIKIGYADVSFYQDPKSGDFTVKEENADGTKNTFVRKVSFLDAPGHETLMTTAISASNIMDGAVLVIAANEQCPQPQTAEHLMVLDILGIKNIVIVQNKIDLVTREKAIENMKQIKAFSKGTIAENAPVIPISANYNSNLSALIEAIQKHIKTPKRDEKAAPLMYVARSFDINKPGTKIESLKGGIIGGSLIQGSVKVGDKVEIRPGIAKKVKDSEVVEPIVLDVLAIHAGDEAVESAGPGGLIAIGTSLDPSVAKSDTLVGNLAGQPGSMPPVYSELVMDVSFLKRNDFENTHFMQNEPLVISAGTATTLGLLMKIKSGRVTVKLKRPLCLTGKSKIAISRRIGQRWRLSAFANLVHPGQPKQQN
ncbi:MAG: translation initiation factor IF-2 subunit gamma [Candidatus Micrarchaeia archaeon]